MSVSLGNCLNWISFTFWVDFAFFLLVLTNLENQNGIIEIICTMYGVHLSKYSKISGSSKGNSLIIDLDLVTYALRRVFVIFGVEWSFGGKNIWASFNRNIVLRGFSKAYQWWIITSKLYPASRLWGVWHGVSISPQHALSQFLVLPKLHVRLRGKG